VVDSVLSTLDLELRRPERESIRARGTSDPEAYDLYLRGRGYLQDYEKTENVDSAITVLSRAVERAKSFAAAHGKLGSAFLFKYRQTHDAAWIERARQSCDRSRTLAENDVSGHVCFGSYYSYTGKYELAAEEFKKAIKLEPIDPALYLSLAGALQQSRDFAEAEKTLVQAINLSRSDLGNYKSLANFYVSSGRFEEAARIYRTMTELAPDNFRGYQNLGAMYIYLGRYRDALPALEKSVSIRPTAGAYSNLATAHFYLKDYAAAADGYRQAIALDPRDNTYWRNLGDAYYWNPDTQGQASTAYIKAVELCQQALKVNPKDVRLLRNLGMSQAMLNRRRDAVDTLRTFAELSPKDPVSLYDAALIYAHFRDRSATWLWLKKALDAGTTAAMVRDTPDLQEYLKDAKFKMLLQNKR
jgi:eukaryotic-like serine/threonine-protein kinase